jgi:hypothetical protein
MEMDSIVWFTFDEMDSFVFERGPQIMESLVKKPGKQE